MAPYQVIALYLEGQASEKLINTIHEILLQQGGCLNSDCLLFLNDADDDDDVEPEVVSDPLDNLQKLAGWPKFGTITYDMPDGEISVTYSGEDVFVYSVTISILNSVLEREDIYEDRDSESWRRYIAVARNIHDVTRSSRTIFDWGLIENGFKWNEERQKMSENNFQGTYKYLDLKRQKIEI